MTFYKREEPSKSESPSQAHAVPKDAEHTAQVFSKLMFQGKTKAALRLITEQCKGSVLHLDTLIPHDHPDSEPKTVHEILTSKHPPHQPAPMDSLYNRGLDPPIIIPSSPV